jgi:hypothetical protein
MNAETAESAERFGGRPARRAGHVLEPDEGVNVAFNRSVHAFVRLGNVSSLRDDRRSDVKSRTNQFDSAVSAVSALKSFLRVPRVLRELRGSVIRTYKA